MEKKGVKKKSMNYYAFLDVALDVFYGIVLYNAIIEFPGMRIESFLMVFSIFIMINYWWIKRSVVELPKHYLFDFYILTVIMFLFSIWPSYYLDVKTFLYILTAIFAVDAVYSWLSIYVHTETTDEPFLKFCIITEISLALFYFWISYVIHILNWVFLVLLFAPYIVFLLWGRRRGFFKTKFIASENEPY